MRLFRPFPSEALRDAVNCAGKIAIIDRNVSQGSGGIFAQEVRSAIAVMAARPPTVSYIAGIGGTDVTEAVIERIVADVRERTVYAEQPIWVREGL